ncbi:MAG TPA: hypothetical protein V6D28_26150 [Leptolyngbyaceae cyanobacterium]
MVKQPYLSLLLLFCLAISPAIVLAIVILKYSVNVPFLDQWDIANYLIKYYSQGYLSFSDLIAQHNESRPLFPKIFFIALASLTDWNVRYEMLFTFLLACLVSLNIYVISNFTIKGKLNKKLVVISLANLLIFSPIQHDNWLWGIQIITFIPIACITTCILIAYSSINLKLKLFISICLSTISTFSYANGMLCWIVVLPVIALKNQLSFRKEKGLYILWLGAFLSNLVLYFYGYQKPANHPSFTAALLHPLKTISFFFAFLGSPLGFKNLIVATIIGVILLFVFIICCIYLFKERKDSLICYAAIGWVTIGLYSIISAFITTLGRVGFGVKEALTSKYTTFSLYLIVSIIYLAVIIYQDAANKGYLIKIKFYRKNTVIFAGNLILTFIFLYILCWDNALGRMISSQGERLQGKTCLLFVNIVPEETCLINKLYPSFPKVKETANQLNRLGLIQPNLVTSNQIKQIDKSINMAGQDDKYGWFDSLNNVDKDIYLAAGWARLPDTGIPADSVVLTYENEKVEATVFAVADRRIKIKNVAKFAKKKPYSRSGWQKYFEASRLPKGLLKLNAWAFDTDTGEAFKIGGTHILENK